MDFEEFKEQIAKDLKEVLYSRYGMDASVEQRTVEKLNSAYDALTVKPEDCEIGVSMNLDTLYDAYRNGEAYDVVLNKAAELADGSLRNKPEFNIENIMNYDVMKETLVMEVVSADRNADFLKNIPLKNIEDLAVVYRFQVCGMEDGHGTILVTNDLLDKYGITAEQLTDNVYHYDAEAKIFERGDKFVQRQQAKEAGIDMGEPNVDKDGIKGEIVNEKAHEAKSEVQGEKKSLIADLKAKKEQIAATPKKENTPEIKPKAKGGDAR